MGELLTPQQLHDYQRECVLHQLYHNDSMLWLQMGLGKTPITLTTIVDRMRAGQVQKTLILAPLRVVQAVWAREARKWEHTKHLRFSVIHGVKEKRLRALFADADVFLTNYENLNWLADQLDHYYLSQGKPLPFQFCVYDEVSKMKNSTTKRMAGGKNKRKDRQGKEYEVKTTGWRKILPHFTYRTGLTGTPASNGYIDLHGQYLAVDGGKRLGEYITHYRDSYFQSDYMGWAYAPTDIGKKWIEYQISDITKKMDAADYLDMPEVKTTNLMVELPPKAKKAYDEIEADMFAALESGREIEVFSRSSVSNKCLQFCNGSPYYDETGKWEAIHDAKLDALEDVLEEAGGSPVLCSYSFKADAERIMTRFKKYHPVNLTATKSSDTEQVIDKWNNGKIKLLIGHPACLHPWTEVLTERNGWVKLIDVESDDRVFDGVEFVNHDGVSYSGYKDVIDIFGITMTPDHKIMVSGEWMRASDVRDNQTSRSEAIFQWETIVDSSGKMHQVRRGIGTDASECGKAQSLGENSLPSVCGRSVSPVDRHPDMADLDGNASPSKQSNGSQLRRSRDRNVRGMAAVREFLFRHGGWLFGRSDDRTNRCERSLLQGELQMGDEHGAAGEQANQPQSGISRRGDSPRRVMQANRVQQDDVVNETESRDDCGRSGKGCNEFTVWEEYRAEEHEASRKTDVYDIVNCGPRHRFLIRNDEGETFLSHNSMGHGVDGLQDSGSILVWFGVNWSLELYEQMCGRLNRQGQKQPVSIIRILCKDTIDLAVADAIQRKTDDQDGLKRALQRYRQGLTTNELEVNFF